LRDVVPLTEENNLVERRCAFNRREKSSWETMQL